MHTAEVVVVDTMTFSYLRGLRRLDWLWRVATATGGLAVTKAVVQQVQRSGELGPLLHSACERGELHCFSPVQGDDISRAVAKVLSSKDGKLVRGNRVDVELVEVAKFRDGAVLTSENGIHKLAHRRNVRVLDLAEFLGWCEHLDLISQDDAESAVSVWSGKQGPGTGRPTDFAGTLRDTLTGRPAAYELIASLPRLV